MDPHSPLNIFYIVAEERSFTRAARRLFRSQPAISQAVQRLEEQLGEVLLDRSGRDITLTDAGRIVFEAAQRQETLFREMAEQIQALRGNAEGRLAIQTPEGLELDLVKHLGRFRELYPKVKVVIQTCASSDLAKQIRAGRAGFGITDALSLDERFSFVALGQAPMVLVATGGHSLASIGKAGFQALSRETFVEPACLGAFMDRLATAFRKQAAHLDIGVQVSTVEGALSLVRSGQGISLMPRTWVEEDLRRGSLREVPMEGRVMLRQVHLVYGAHRSLGHAARAFLDMIRSPDYADRPLVLRPA